MRFELSPGEFCLEEALFAERESDDLLERRFELVDRDNRALGVGSGEEDVVHDDVYEFVERVVDEVEGRTGQGDPDRVGSDSCDVTRIYRE